MPRQIGDMSVSGNPSSLQMPTVSCGLNTPGYSNSYSWYCLSINAYNLNGDQASTFSQQNNPN